MDKRVIFYEYNGCIKLLILAARTNSLKIKNHMFQEDIWGEILESDYIDVDVDLGHYVLLLESEADVEELKINKLKELLPEYIDEIKSDDGTKYYSSLFLLSSD